MKPLAIDLFCGLGGWTDGLLAEGYDVTGYDIEAHAYGEERYPAELVLQDVLTLDGVQFKDAALIVASPPCFVAETLILTTRGLIPIPEVAVGDFVLTHRNRWRRVLRAGSTVAATMTARGFGGSLEGTAEHPIYARRNEGGFSVWDKSQKAPVNVLKKLGDPNWIPLGDIKGCHWASPTAFDPLPVPALPNGLPDDPSFWWIVGRWVGDGWVRMREETRSGDEVIICCAHSEADDLEMRLADFAPRQGTRAGVGELHWRRSKERTATRFTCASNSLAEWLTAHFGRGAEHKSWPAWALGMNEDCRRALLDGYVSADGCVGRNGPTSIVKTGTVSKRLAIATRLLAASIGAASNVFFYARPPTCQIEGRTVQQRDTWTVTWTPASAGNRSVDSRDGFQWGKVRDVEPSQASVRVWNIEVDEDNSYTADGIVVHNCQEFSYMAMPWKRAKQIARALRGQDDFPEGYRGSRTIAELTALFDACFRIQREASEAAGHRIPLVVENVRGAEPWVGRARWSFGSYYLWGDVPALMPRTITARKNPGFRFDGSGRSFQSESVNRHVGEGRKHHGDWFRDLDCPSRQGGQSRPRAEGVKRPGLKLSEEGFNVSMARELAPSLKGVKYNRTEDDKRQHLSIARKAASAKIAKIPFALSAWIARTYKPAPALTPP